MIEGKTRKNRFRLDPGAPTAIEAVGEGSGGTIGCELRGGIAVAAASERCVVSMAGDRSPTGDRSP
jgi:hypothetical protein